MSRSQVRMVAEVRLLASNNYQASDEADTDSANSNQGGAALWHFQDYPQTLSLKVVTQSSTPTPSIHRSLE